MAKTEFMGFLMEPEEKIQLEDKAHELRVTQGELIRRALAFYYACQVSVTDHTSQEVEGAPA